MTCERTFHFIRRANLRHVSPKADSVGAEKRHCYFNFLEGRTFHGAQVGKVIGMYHNAPRHVWDIRTAFLYDLRESSGLLPFFFPNSLIMKGHIEHVGEGQMRHGGTQASKKEAEDRVRVLQCSSTSPQVRE